MFDLNKQKAYMVELSEVVPLFIIFIFGVIALFCIPYYGFYGIKKDAEYQAFYYCMSLSFTALLIAIAYIQLNGVKKRLKADFLLNIDWRWGNKENLKARVIIHEFYLKSEGKYGKATSANSTKILDDVAHQILDLRDSTIKDDPKRFITLLNFLDFMETIGYLKKCGYVDLNDLNELCGFSLRFNYEVFRLYIEDKNRRHGRGSFYNYFTDLQTDLTNRI